MVCDGPVSVSRADADGFSVPRYRALDAGYLHRHFGAEVLVLSTRSDGPDAHSSRGAGLSRGDASDQLSAVNGDGFRRKALDEEVGVDRRIAVGGDNPHVFESGVIAHLVQRDPLRGHVQIRGPRLIPGGITEISSGTLVVRRP